MFTFWHVFECFVFWRCNSLIFHWPWLSIIPRQLGYIYISQIRYQFCWFLRRRHFLIKFQSFRLATLKVTPMKVFYCDYCKIFKIGFIEHLQWLLLLLVKEDLYFKIWHDYFYLNILVCKFWLTDSFRALKNMRGDFFDFKMLLTIFSLLEQSL